MRQVLINELSKEEAKVVGEFLTAHTKAAGVAGLYWLAIPRELLGEAQRGHEDCGPFAFAVEAGDDFVSFELLVRSESNLHCSCTCYANAEQRAFLLDFMDRLTGAGQLKA